MKYDIDILYNNPKALATIIFPSTGTPDSSGTNVTPQPIYGLVENDFNFDIHSLYSSVDPGLTAAAQTVANAEQALIGGSNRVIKNIQQTLQRWDGHTSPNFTVPITIVKYKESIDIIGQIRTLTSAVAGTYETPFTMKAPYGYGFNGLVDPSSLIQNAINASNPVAAAAQQLKAAAVSTYQSLDNLNNQYRDGTLNAELTKDLNNLLASNYQNISTQVYGTWTLKYSDWFIVPDLIITGVSSLVSKEAVKGTNEPLYARINVSFTTAYLPDARQIASWFLPAQSDTGYNSVNSLEASAANIANRNSGAPLG